MKNTISVAELKPPERHCQPTFDVCRQKYYRSILDNKFQICVEELEHEIQISLRREDVE